jgi:hypothetical protein
MFAKWIPEALEKIAAMTGGPNPPTLAAVERATGFLANQRESDPPYAVSHWPPPSGDGIALKRPGDRILIYGDSRSIKHLSI